jgi:hypothetical protein
LSWFERVCALFQKDPKYLELYYQEFIQQEDKSLQNYMDASFLVSTVLNGLIPLDSFLKSLHESDQILDILHIFRSILYSVALKEKCTSDIDALLGVIEGLWEKLDPAQQDQFEVDLDYIEELFLENLDTRKDLIEYQKQTNSPLKLKNRMHRVSKHHSKFHSKYHSKNNLKHRSQRRFKNQP